MACVVVLPQRALCTVDQARICADMGGCAFRGFPDCCPGCFVVRWAFFAAMVLVGMPTGYAVALSVFEAFVATFIPAVGTYIGAAVPIFPTLAVQGLVAALILLVWTIIYQQIENYWLSPKISAGTMELNGGVAFGAPLAGGAIAGIWSASGPRDDEKRDETARDVEWSKSLVCRVLCPESHMWLDRLNGLITRRSQVRILPPLHRRPLAFLHVPRVFSRLEFLSAEKARTAGELLWLLRLAVPTGSEVALWRRQPVWLRS